MTKEEALEALSSIFAEVLDEKDIELDYQMTANDVDRWDSITNMTIISEIESRFNIKLKLREIIKLKNVGALCDAIVSKSK
ncbi:MULTISPECIES: acyl carrier protein [Prevotella]|jgi:Phosphopantetheine attachment site.|uniref:Acyl carrier protein n=1 Tax=Prevotella herbatica TaxID=2801997 RepID=A0ABM7NW55_9BACT|nr:MULTISPECIES: acyl carrier protein [Prevotella]MDN5554674.1 acyl carrier protein [Prevotella sp.]BCS84694.1 acyl carrier protein [Prevotella herbatica]